MIPVGVCLATFGTRYAELRAAAQRLDALGANSLWVWDHYVSWNDPREPVLEGLTTLAGLAEATQRIKLGPLVANNTNRHPARLAKIGATMQELSGGRFELGLGAGGLAFEQTPFGIAQGDAAQRRGQVAEALQIIAALWRGEPVTFHGQYYDLNNAICAPAPQPAPPLILGANGPKMARIAGRYADGLNLQWRDRASFDVQLAACDAGLAERGRARTSFDLSIHVGWNDFTRDPQALLTQCQQWGFARTIVYLGAPFTQIEQFDWLEYGASGTAEGAEGTKEQRHHAPM